VRGCSCRGPHAGFVHIRCLVKNAEENGEDDHVAYTRALTQCGQCRQSYHGAVRIALCRAAWLHYASCSENFDGRLVALLNLGAALTNVQRLDEALVVNEEFVTTIRRMYGSDDERTIDSEERLAVTLLRQGGDENLRSALQTLRRTYAWRVEIEGSDDEKTLQIASHLADAHRFLGNFHESERLRRDVVNTRRGVMGEEHSQTLEAQWLLAHNLILQHKLDEARNIRDRLLPVASRVLGPDHSVTSVLRGI